MYAGRYPQNLGARQQRLKHGSIASHDKTIPAAMSVAILSSVANNGRDTISSLRKNQMTNETKNIVVEKITEFIKEYGAYCVLANAYNSDSGESSALRKYRRTADAETYVRIQGEADEVLVKISAAIFSAINNAEDVAFVNGEIQGVREGETLT